MNKIILALFFSVSVCLMLSGVCLAVYSPGVYYVDSLQGDDNNSGTDTAPFKSLNKALSIVNSGMNTDKEQTVFLRNGNYGKYSDKTARTAWLYIKADTNSTPEIDYIHMQKLPSTAEDSISLYVSFEGIHFTGENGSGQITASLYGMSEVKFINCDFIGDGYWYTGGLAMNQGLRITRGKNFEIDGCRFYGRNDVYEGGYQWAIYGRHDVHDVVIRNCEFKRSRFGVTVYASDTEVKPERWTIENNLFHYLDSDGVILQGSVDALIQDNVFCNVFAPVRVFQLYGKASYSNETGIITLHPSDGDIFAVDELGYANQWARLTLDDNTIIPANADPIPQWAARCAQIESNTLNTITIKPDYRDVFGKDFNNIVKLDIIMGYHIDLIQFQGKEVRPVIRRNIFYNSTQALTLQPDWAVGTVIENNLACNISGTMLQVMNNSEMVIRNNTFAGRILFRKGTQINSITSNIADTITFEHTMPAPPDFEDYNIARMWGFSVNMHKDFMPGANSIAYYNYYKSLGNSNEESYARAEEAFKALFTDSENNDFTLSAVSRARDYGVAEYSSSEDIMKNPRDGRPDIGCFEFGTPNPSFEEYKPYSPDRHQPEDIPETVVNASFPARLEVQNNILKTTVRTSAKITVNVTNPGHLLLKIYDARGKEIVLLHDGHTEPRIIKYDWGGTDKSGSKVGSGVYIVFMKINGVRQTKKIVVVK